MKITEVIGTDDYVGKLAQSEEFETDANRPRLLLKHLNTLRKMREHEAEVNDERLDLLKICTASLRMLMTRKKRN